MKKHALLSASSAHRWLECPPSARLEERYTVNTETTFSLEGTLAHSLGEARLKFEFGQIGLTEYTVELDRIKSNEMYNKEMADAIDLYVDTVLAEYQKHNDIIIERTVNYSKWAKEGYGTADVILIGEEAITVIDLKYGKGIQVEAKDNPQLRLYALGAYDTFGMLYYIKTIRTIVVQPRRDNISIEEITVEGLLTWGESIKLISQQAFNGEGETKVGDHCKWCKHKLHCTGMIKTTHAMANIAFEGYGSKEGNKPFSSLTSEELKDILDKKDIVTEFLKSVSEWALKESIDNGLNIDGYKLVLGRANRKYIDEKEVEKVLLENGITGIHRLLTITEIEKLLGKTEFNTLLGDLIAKPEGAPTLVPDTDKRAAWSKLTAKEAFQGI